MSAIRKYASRAHRKIAKVIGLALIAGDSHAWLQAKLLMRVHLTAPERAALAFASMASLDKDQRDAVARSTIPAVLLGPPLPTLNTVQDDAKWWASNADEQEREVYLLACFNALDAERQQAFAQFINKKDAA